MTNELYIERFINKEIDSVLGYLPMSGKMKVINNSFAYLDIDDNFIHHIFPLLDNNQIRKPNYFNGEKNFIGAHISTIYPEEHTNIIKNNLNESFSFEIEGLFRAHFLQKKYYILKVRSKNLLNFRLKHGLSNKLLFRGYLVDFHITIAADEIVSDASH